FFFIFNDECLGLMIVWFDEQLLLIEVIPAPAFHSNDRTKAVVQTHALCAPRSGIPLLANLPVQLINVNRRLQCMDRTKIPGHLPAIRVYHPSGSRLQAGQMPSL